MVKQEKDYQCVPPERVAQLLKLGVGYEGYIEFHGGHKIFVEISPNDNVMINQRCGPADTVLSVYVSKSENPMMVETERHWSLKLLETMQQVNGIVGLAAGAVENFSTEGIMRFTKGGKFSPKYYNSDWQGGSRANIKTYKVVVDKFKSGAKTVGRRCFVIGIGLDVISSSIGEQSWGKTTVNVVFSTIGMLGGPTGWIISGLYFGLDLVGAFDGPAHIVPTPKDPMKQYTNPADATRVERVRPIDPIPQQKPQYTPREQPVLKQGSKKY